MEVGGGQGMESVCRHGWYGDIISASYDVRFVFKHAHWQRELLEHTFVGPFSTRGPFVSRAFHASASLSRSFWLNHQPLLMHCSSLRSWITNTSCFTLAAANTFRIMSILMVICSMLACCCCFRCRCCCFRVHSSWHGHQTTAS